MFYLPWVHLSQDSRFRRRRSMQRDPASPVAIRKRRNARNPDTKPADGATRLYAQMADVTLVSCEVFDVSRMARKSSPATTITGSTGHPGCNKNNVFRVRQLSTTAANRYCLRPSGDTKFQSAGASKIHHRRLHKSGLGEASRSIPGFQRSREGLLVAPAGKSFRTAHEAEKTWLS